MTATGLADLFKYKDELVIRSPKTGRPTKHKVWIRVLGDEDIKNSYTAARVASAKVRAAMKDENSQEYLDTITQLHDMSQADLRDLILAEAENGFINQAPIIVDREELPELAEVAAEPDAPTLEEQENLDKKLVDQEKDFLAKLQEYIDTKKTELNAELDTLSEEDIFERAKKTMQNIRPLQAMAEELGDQKGFRGTYIDKDCKIRGYESLEDFKNAHSSVRQQIINKYNDLEMSPDDIKE
jgi:hypothetical protein